MDSQDIIIDSEDLLWRIVRKEDIDTSGVFVDSLFYGHPELSFYWSLTTTPKQAIKAFRKERKRLGKPRVAVEGVTAIYAESIYNKGLIPLLDDDGSHVTVKWDINEPKRFRRYRRRVWLLEAKEYGWAYKKKHFWKSRTNILRE